MSHERSRLYKGTSYFDYLAVRLTGPKAAGRKITLNLDLTDLKKRYVSLDDAIKSGELKITGNPDAFTELPVAGGPAQSALVSRPCANRPARGPAPTREEQG